MPYDLRFVPALPDPAAFETLMFEYYAGILPTLAQAGGPTISPGALTAETMANVATLLPPDGRTLLAHDAAGALVGCGVIRRIRPDAAELKRMYVRPAARGHGLGRKLFELRIEEAERMGCTTLYADTVKGNRAMLSMYERMGFSYIPRYPENANPPEWSDVLVYLQLQFSTS